MRRLQPKILPLHAREVQPHRPRPRYDPLPAPRAALGRALTRTSGQVIAGFVIGHLGVIVFDWAIGGPGPFVVFGL